MKNSKKMTMLIIGGIVLLLTIILIGMYWSYNNQEIALRKRAAAQEDNITAVHDKMWKTIQQSAGVAKEYAEQFDSIYKDIMSGRYAGNGIDDGSLMRWIQESNPEFSAALYSELQVQIESLRGEFAENQRIMLDLVREHATLCEQFPSRFFISDKSPIVYEVISSTRTQDVLVTRKDDNVDLF